MKSYSQSGQDLFVVAIMGENHRGTFLDIGCCHPTELSNTCALEQRGWTGLMIDNDQNAAELCQKQRAGKVICNDATKVDWPIVMMVCNHEIDYLSLDVDGATLDTLKRMPLDQLRFNVITIEHDSYRFGDGPRNEMRRILFCAGYDLACKDVCSSDGLPYEDWHVAPEFTKIANRFRCSNQKWSDILKR